MYRLCLVKPSWVCVNWCVFLFFRNTVRVTQRSDLGLHLLCKEYYSQYSEDFTCAQYFCALICKGKYYILCIFTVNKDIAGSCRWYCVSDGVEKSWFMNLAWDLYRYILWTVEICDLLVTFNKCFGMMGHISDCYRAALYAYWAMCSMYWTFPAYSVKPQAYSW